MNKHTPGPWTVDDIYIESAYGCRPGETEVLAVAVGRPNKLEHNARLIAAAPELLETLEAVSEWLTWNDTGDEAIAELHQRVEDTLHKAKHGPI